MATTVSHPTQSDHPKLIGYLVAAAIAALVVVAFWQAAGVDSSSPSSPPSVPAPNLVDSTGLGDALSVTYDVPLVARLIDPTGLGAALSVDPGRRVGNDPMGLGAVFGAEIPTGD